MTLKIRAFTCSVAVRSPIGPCNIWLSVFVNARLLVDRAIRIFAYIDPELV